MHEKERPTRPTVEANPQAETVVGVFASLDQACHVAEDLRKAGFPKERLSVISQGSNSQPHVGVEDTHSASGAAAGATAGAVLGGALGLAAFAIPGIGPILAAGPIASALTGVLAGGAMGGLAGSFAGMGVPTEHGQAYESAVRTGGAVLAIEGLEADSAEHAECTLTAGGAREVARFHPGA
jgi:hypothetical protein